MIRKYIRKLCNRDNLVGFLADGIIHMEKLGPIDPSVCGELERVRADLLTVAEASLITKTNSYDMEKSFENATTINRRKFIVRSSSSALAGALAIFFGGLCYENASGRGTTDGGRKGRDGCRDSACEYEPAVCDGGCNNVSNCEDSNSCKDFGCENSGGCRDLSGCLDSQCVNTEFICVDEYNCSDEACFNAVMGQIAECSVGSFVQTGCSDDNCINGISCKNMPGSIPGAHCIDNNCEDTRYCRNDYYCEDNGCVDLLVCDIYGGSVCDVQPVNQPEICGDD